MFYYCIPYTDVLLLPREPSVLQCHGCVTHSRDCDAAAGFVQPRVVMLSSLRSYTLNTVHIFRSARPYSASVDAVTNVGKIMGAPGALRPTLNVSVNPNHGLYAFFRKREKDGKVIHDPLEDHSGLHDVFGK
jgi:hypothetical protein